MLDPAYAFVSSIIWAISPIYYRTFLKKLDFLVLNLVRTSIASLVLATPALYYGLGSGVGYALLSGAITLAVGDSLFLLSIREMGASIAAPVVYTYVLFVQLTATAVGEVVPPANVVAALMVIAGVYVLSKGGGTPRAKGIAQAIGAGVAWTAGQDMIRLSTNAGGNVFVVAFSRNLAAALALSIAVLATGKFRVWPREFSEKELVSLCVVVVSDLVVGSVLYIYSVSLIGIAVTVILTSLSPLLTQVFSKLMGKESPSGRDFIGGALIVSAVLLAVII